MPIRFIKVAEKLKLPPAVVLGVAMGATAHQIHDNYFHGKPFDLPAKEVVAAKVGGVAAAYAGAKAGAFLGTLFFGPGYGTGAGAVAGAVVGGLAGEGVVEAAIKNIVGTPVLDSALNGAGVTKEDQVPAWVRQRLPAASDDLDIQKLIDLRQIEKGLERSHRGMATKGRFPSSLDQVREKFDAAAIALAEKQPGALATIFTPEEKERFKIDVAGKALADQLARHGDALAHHLKDPEFRKSLVPKELQILQGYDGLADTRKTPEPHPWARDAAQVREAELAASVKEYVTATGSKDIPLGRGRTMSVETKRFDEERFAGLAKPLEKIAPEKIPSAPSPDSKPSGEAPKEMAAAPKNKPPGPV